MRNLKIHKLNVKVRDMPPVRSEMTNKEEAFIALNDVIKKMNGDSFSYIDTAKECYSLIENYSKTIGSALEDRGALLHSRVILKGDVCCNINFGGHPICNEHNTRITVYAEQIRAK